MAKFLMKETVSKDLKAITVRLGATADAAGRFTSAEDGKAVKLGGESRYIAAVAGDLIEGLVVAVESFTQDGYSIGSIIESGKVEAMFDGLQATPGVGGIAVGDYVVVGTPVAKGTSLGSNPFKVAKATVQLGAVPADLTAAGLAIKASKFAWRVVSLGTVGTGAVGTVGLIERVGL